MVFSYQKTSFDDSNIVDDEKADIIRFEINKDLERFSFINNELQQINAYYDESSLAFIPTTGITEGIISGTKINDTSWNINKCNCKPIE